MKKVKFTIKINAPKQIIKRLGLDTEGDVQRQLTNMVNHRITRYMPERSGMLSTKSKRIVSPTEIEVAAPYAHYQYKGEVYGPNIPIKENGVIVGYFSPPSKHRTGRRLDQTKGKNERGGPYWEKRLMAAEGTAITADLQRYIDLKAGKR